MIAFSTALAAALLLRQGSALPTVKRDAPPQQGSTIANLLVATYKDFLSIQNGNISKFYALESWYTADFVAPNATFDPFMANNMVYSTADRLSNYTAGTNSTDGASITFSSQYEGFIQEINSALGFDNLTKDPELQNLTTQAGEACTDGVSDSASVALQKYLKLHPSGNTSITIDNDNFLRWANSNYPPYIEARQDCQIATNAFDKRITDLYGPDGSVYAAALNNIQPLIGPGGQVDTPGVTMPLSSTGIDSKVGNLAPLYSFPSLNGTIQAWRAGGSAPTYSKTVDSQTIASQTDSSSSSAHVGVTSIFGIGGDASASNSNNNSLATTSVASMTVSFGGIQLMNVYRGIWFDNWRSATALNNDNSDDDKHKAAKKVFNQYIGTADKPGSAALYNNQALVAYQPFVNITFSSQSQYDAAHSDSAGASASGIFGLVNAGADSSHSSGTSEFHNDTLSIVFQDKTPTAYIFGYVLASFWDAP